MNHLQVVVPPLKPERGIVCDVHGARPKLRAQQTDAVLSQVWLGTHGTWLSDLLLGSPDVETATTSFIWMDEACYLEYVTVLLRGTEEACWGWSLCRSLLGVPGLVETLEDGKT